jgi:hypothetical protein
MTLRGSAHPPHHHRLGVRHAHRAGADNRHVFIGRPLNGLNGVPTVVTHQMQNVDAVDRPSFTIRVFVAASRDESKQCA